MIEDLRNQIQPADKARRTLTEDETNKPSELKLKMGLLLVALQDAKLLPPITPKMSKRRVPRDSTPSEIVEIKEGGKEAKLREKNPESDPIVRERAAPSPTIEEGSVGEDTEQERAVVEVDPETGRVKSSSRPSLILEDRTMAYEKECVSSDAFLLHCLTVISNAMPQQAT